MAILSCEALSKTYASGETAVHAVQEISLAFEQGSFTAITGPSGSGKSTLLHMLGALEYPTGGKVFFQNADLFAYNDNQLSVLRRRRFGFVFQAYNLVRELTGYENILLPVMLDKRAPDEAYIGHLIDMLEIRDRVDHLPSALSGGQQQRISIARALANKPAILFADEPTGNLDTKTGEEVMELLKNIFKERNTTFILVSHDPDMRRYAGREIHIQDGIIRTEESVISGGKVI